jgi:hypothetical protein
MKTTAFLTMTAICFALVAMPAAADDPHPQSNRAPQLDVATATASADATRVAGNCLLPGQIRGFGSITMLTPKRAVTLDAGECAARGGEPIAGSAVAN